MFYSLSIGVIDSSKGRGANTVDVTEEDGVATMVYTPLSGELNKPPVVDDLVITANGPYAEDTILTATLTGHVNGPFEAGTHEYQWYQLDDLQGGTLSAIVGATSSTYTLVAGDVGSYIVCMGRYVQSDGGNPNSAWFESEATEIIAGAASGDIVFAWEDIIDFSSSGQSVPSNANTVGEACVYPNLGTGEDWTGTATYKPTWDGTAMVFDKALGNRIMKPSAITYPMLGETWMIIEFTATGGQAYSFGSNNLLGLNSSTNFTANGMTPQTGSLTERVVRVVRNGASSIFQVDGGTEVTFTDSSSTASFLMFGTTYTGGAPASFRLKYVWRTPHNTFLNNTQRDDRWVYFGF